MPKELDLIDLISEQPINYDEIRNLIFSLEESSFSENGLTVSRMLQARAPETGATALHKACEILDEELICFLLNLGADPMALDSSGRRPQDYISNSGEAQIRIQTMIELYQCFFQEFNGYVKWSLSSFLIKKAAYGLKANMGLGASFPAILFFGETRKGKSTFINYLLGTCYSKKRMANGAWNLLPDQPELEQAKVGLTGISETFYPAVYLTKYFSLVDFPGFYDNRDGLDEKEAKPYQIAAGACMGLLKNFIPNIAQLVLVMDMNDLISDNVLSVVKPFDSMSTFMPPIEYEFCFVHNLTNEHEKSMGPGKIYIDFNGDYIVHDVQGILHKASLKGENLDLSDLNMGQCNKLEILKILKQRGHVHTIEELLSHTTLILTKSDKVSPEDLSIEEKVHLKRHKEHFEQLACLKDGTLDSDKYPRVKTILDLFNHFIENPHKVVRSDLSNNQTRVSVLQQNFSSQSSFSINELDFDRYNEQLRIFREFLISFDSKQEEITAFIRQRRDKYNLLARKERELSQQLEELSARGEWGFFETKLIEMEENAMRRAHLEDFLEKLEIRKELVIALSKPMDDIKKLIFEKKIDDVEEKNISRQVFAGEKTFTFFQGMAKMPSSDSPIQEERKQGCTIS